jgi:transcriptional regulator with XRE-family HTH domain
MAADGLLRHGADGPPDRSHGAVSHAPRGQLWHTRSPNGVRLTWRHSGAQSTLRRSVSTGTSGPTTLALGVPSAGADVVALVTLVRSVRVSTSDGSSGEYFGGLVLKLRARIGLTQRELARRLNLHSHSVQAWESGTSVPSVASLRLLIEVAARAGAFPGESVLAEAAAIWDAAMHQSTRLRVPFDQAWFKSIVDPAQAVTRAQSLAPPLPAAPTPPRSTTASRQSWGEAPDVRGFVGRVEERDLLRDCVTDQRCRLVALLGLGGIGKTALATRRWRSPSSERPNWRWCRAPCSNRAGRSRAPQRLAPRRQHLTLP